MIALTYTLVKAKQAVAPVATDHNFLTMVHTVTDKWQNRWKPVGGMERLKAVAHDVGNVLPSMILCKKIYKGGISTSKTTSRVFCELTYPPSASRCKNA